MAPPLSPSSQSWRELADDAQRVLQRQFLGDKSLALYDALGAHALDASTGGALFFAGISVAQLAQKALRIGAATPVLPKVIGAAAVASSSAVALHFASLPREIYEDVVRQERSRDAERASLARLWSSLWSSSDADAQPHAATAALARAARQKIQSRVEDLSAAPYPVYMLMGVLCFTMLGGRMTAVAPSNYSNLGAFHLKKASLPATAEYATPIERGIIQEFGRLYGCHTCGVKRGVKYHADHMPPKLVAERMNANILRRLVGHKVAFRFYPQCEPCSNQQGTVVKQWATKLRTHVASLRLYHSTGVWLVLLCTGGLYVGGSSFHEMADVAAAPAPARPSADVTAFTNHHATSEHALLVSLRERESKLRKTRARTADAAEVAALTAEIDAIGACKAALKASLKRARSGTRASS